MSVRRLLLVVGLAGALAAAAAATPKPRVLPTTTPVSGLAADGSTVAVATAWSAGHCERMVAWDPVAPSLRAVGRSGRCDQTSTGRGILGQAVAGTRVAWVWDGGGNQHDSVLFAASLAKPQAAHRLATATRDIGTAAGSYVGGLHGAGSLLAYASWSVCDTGEVTFKRCPTGVAPGTIYDSKLWRVEGTTVRKLLATAADQLVPIAVSAGRILVQRADGSLELRAADGHIVRTFALDAIVQQAALGPKDLVVAVRSVGTNPPISKGRLQFQVYSLATGDLERTLPVPAAALTATASRCEFPTDATPAACVSPLPRLRLANADTRRFAYVLDTTVHVARLDGSKDTTFAPAGRAPASAELTASGLAYAYRTGGSVRGRVQFVPAAQLP